METKKFWQSKTVWVGILTILVSILILVSEFLQAGNFEPAALVALVSGALTVILRFLTNTEIEK